jgi:hypothetical protein
MPLKMPNPATFGSEELSGYGIRQGESLTFVFELSSDAR